MPTALAYVLKKRLTLFLLVLLIAILVVAALRLTRMPALNFSPPRRAGFDTAASSVHGRLVDNRTDRNLNGDSRIARQDHADVSTVIAVNNIVAFDNLARGFYGATLLRRWLTTGCGTLSRVICPA